MYDWNGENQVYVAGQWTSSSGLTEEQRLLLESVSSIAEGRMVMIGGNGFLPAPASVNSNDVMFDVDVQIPSESLRIDDIITVSENTGFLNIRNNVTQLNFQILDALHTRADGSFRPNQFFLRKQNTDEEGNDVGPRVFQPDFSSQIESSDITFNYTTTILAQTNVLRFKTYATMTNVRMRIIDTTTGIPFKHIPSRVVWDSNENGLSFSQVGDNEIDLGSSTIRLEDGRGLTIEIKSNQNGLLGTSTGVPYFAGDVQLAAFRGLAWLDDIGNQDHPITISRDMPDDAELTALAASSLNGNSAVWEIANDQLDGSNRNTVMMVAQVPGLLDVDGNEIPTTAVTADTLKLRAGTTVRVFSSTDVRVTTSPLFESDISQSIVFVFDDLTISNANLATYNRKTLVCNLTGISKTITIAQNTDIDYFDVFVGESTPLLVETQGLERINDEIDKRFTSNQGGRIKKMTAGGQYGIIYSASNDLANSGSQAPHTVETGRCFRFSESDANYDGTVFQVRNNVQSIAFSNETIDIPAITGEAFHVVGEYIALQYNDGIAFARVISTTSTGGIGDIEATLVQTISFTDGKEFTLPNVEDDVHIGIMSSVQDLDTSVAFETARSSTSQTLGSGFTHPQYVDSSEVVFTLSTPSEATFAVNSVLTPNKYAIGPSSGDHNDAVVITSSKLNPSNDLQVIVGLAGTITVSAGANIDRYDVSSETVRHVIVENGANAEINNGTLRLLPGGGSGLEYEGDAADNNELLSGSADASQVKGSGISTVLDNGQRKIATTSIQGATEIPTNEVAINSPRNLNQPTEFDRFVGKVAVYSGSGDIVFDLPSWDTSGISGIDYTVDDVFAVQVVGSGNVTIRTINTSGGYLEIPGSTSLVVGQSGFAVIARSATTNRFILAEDFVFNPPAREANVPGFVNINAPTLPITVAVNTDISGNWYPINYGVTNAQNATHARIVGFNGSEHMPESVQVLAGDAGIGQAVTVGGTNNALGNADFSSASNKYTVRCELYMTGQTVGDDFPAEYFDFIITAV